MLRGNPSRTLHRPKICSPQRWTPSQPEDDCKRGASGSGRCSARLRHHYLDSYPGGLAQAGIIEDLMACRTAALDGHRRQCPKCQASWQADWLDKQSKNLLNTGYFHIVFTLPHQLSTLPLQNKHLLYGLEFRCACQALLTTAADPTVITS